MAQSAALQNGSVELLVDLMQAERGTGSICTEDQDRPSSSLSTGVWLSYLRLRLPKGSRFLMQSRGRDTLGSWDEANQIWATQELQPHCLGSKEQLRVRHCPYMLLSLSDSVPAPAQGSEFPVSSAGRFGEADSPALVQQPLTLLQLRLSFESQVMSLPVDISVRCSGHYLPISREKNSNVLPSVVCRTLSSYPAGKHFVRMENPAYSPDVGTEEDQLPRTMLITGDLPNSGLLVVECIQGPMVSRCILVVITSDAGLAHELSEVMMEDILHGVTSTSTNLSKDTTQDLLKSLGCWLDYVAAMHEIEIPDSGTRTLVPAVQPSLTQDSASAQSEAVEEGRYHLSSVEDTSRFLEMHGQLMQHYTSYACRTHMAKVGIHLLENALDLGCPRLAACMLRDFEFLGHAGRWLAQQSLTDSHGISLLQRAVASGSVEVVDLLVGWSLQHGIECEWGTVGGGGNEGAIDDQRCMSPLLIARNLNDGGSLFQHIFSTYPAAVSVWNQTEGDDIGTQTQPASIALTPTQESRASIAAAAAAAVAEAAAAAAEAAVADQDPLIAMDRMSKPEDERSADPFTSAQASTATVRPTPISAASERPLLSTSSGLTSLMRDSVTASSNLLSRFGNVSLTRSSTSMPWSTQGSLPRSMPGSMTRSLMTGQGQDYCEWVGRQCMPVVCLWTLILSLSWAVLEAQSVIRGRDVSAVPWDVMPFLQLCVFLLMSLQQHVYLRNWEGLNVGLNCVRIWGRALLALSEAPDCTRHKNVGELVADFVLDGLLPTLCHQVRPSVACVLRAIELFPAALLYMRCESTNSALSAVTFWLVCNGVCVAIAALVSGCHRRSFDAACSLSATRGGVL